MCLRKIASGRYKHTPAIGGVCSKRSRTEWRTTIFVGDVNNS